MGTFHCRGPPRTSAPTSVQVYGAIRELWAVRFGDAQGGRNFTRNNFRTRIVCDVVCDLVGRDVLGAPRAWGRSVVARRAHGDVPLSRAARMGTFRCRGPPRTSAPTSVQVYGAIRELWAVRFGDAQGGRDFTRNNFRTRVVCDVVCALVGRDVLGAPRAEGK